ncbi:hypothetical protein ASAP_2372 [Asaia bogorensis]|uniref:Uncharacterized protein n=1 Tax=Asaia bogorensis TaxID=91915 RepID=A0A060QLK3_9PROT|nr:hypothetical protein ASAP_2372 [Asaia bogorensis]
MLLNRPFALEMRHAAPSLNPVCGALHEVPHATLLGEAGKPLPLSLLTSWTDLHGRLDR